MDLKMDLLRICTSFCGMKKPINKMFLTHSNLSVFNTCNISLDASLILCYWCCMKDAIQIIICATMAESNDNIHLLPSNTNPNEIGTLFDNTSTTIMFQRWCQIQKMIQFNKHWFPNFDKMKKTSLLKTRILRTRLFL